jgi:hypothetical protein
LDSAKQRAVAKVEWAALSRLGGIGRGTEVAPNAAGVLRRGYRRRDTPSWGVGRSSVRARRRRRRRGFGCRRVQADGVSRSSDMGGYQDERQRQAEPEDSCGAGPVPAERHALEGKAARRQGQARPKLPTRGLVPRDLGAPAGVQTAGPRPGTGSGAICRCSHARRCARRPVVHRTRKRGIPR